MIWGGMNAVEPPYTVRIVGTSKCAEATKEEIALLADAIAAARIDFMRRRGNDVSVSIDIEP